MEVTTGRKRCFCLHLVPESQVTPGAHRDSLVTFQQVAGCHPRHVLWPVQPPLVGVRSHWVAPLYMLVQGSSEPVQNVFHIDHI